jgi:hypothetical protein
MDQANDGLKHAVIGAASPPRQVTDLPVALLGRHD